MVTVPHSYRSRDQRIGANPQIVSAFLLAALAVVVASLLTTHGASNAALSRLPVVPATADFSKMPLAFVPNAGQTDPQVRYEVQAMGGVLFFTPNEVVLSLPVAANTDVVRMQFEGSAPQPDLRAGTPLPGVVNFIEGNQPTQWHTNLPTYNGLTYGQLYDGINLHYDGIDGRLKSTYLIAANANPAQIRWHYAGTTNATIDATSGDLHLVLPNTQTPLIERAPIAWQEQNGQRTAVPVRYDLQSNGSVGFALGAYNPALPLTIDPTLEYSTFIGGSGADRINAIAIDSGTGDIFVTGETSSTPFPGSPTSFGVTGAGSFPNVFVARVAANGSSTVYRTIIGGTNTDKGLSIAVTSGGIANVAGYSYSSDFPTTSGAVSTGYNNNGDIIAFALNADGTQAYSTYLGGASTDTGYSIAASGNFLYIAGSTDGVVPGESSSPVGGTDAIVYKIDKSTSGVGGQIYARRLGGLFTDMARAIALDTGGNVYVTGSTLSDNATFATITPYQPNNAGGSDAFITKLDTTGATTYNSFLGGTDTDEGLGIAVDPAGDVVYLTGRTLSSSFPGASGSSSGQDAFVTKINIATNTVAYSRYLGSPGVDVGNAIAIDSTGAAYVVGATSSSLFYSQNPLAEMASNGGNVDGFITRFDPSGNPSYSSRIGGGSDDVATGVATFQSSQGTKVYVSGYTNSSNFPMTVPPTTIQSTIGGSEDGFLVRIANTRPQVDLNDGTTSNGIDFGPVTWTEAGGTVVGSGAVAIDNTTGLTIIDTDSAAFAYAEVRFVASTIAGGTAIVPPDGASESLSVTLSGGITGSYNATTGILRLTNGGSATLSNFQNVLRSVTYNNSSQNPTAGPRLLAVEVSDGIDSNTPFAFSTITVVATNDPPVVTVPGPVTGNEDAAISVAGVSVADADAGSSNIKVTVSVPAAAGTVTATASGSASVTPASAASIDIVGTITDVNATLASLSFTGVTDFNTAAGSPITLTVLASDLGNTPSPAKTDQKTVSITVTPVNDAPVVGSSPVSVTTAEDTPKTISIVSDLGVNDSKDTTSPPAAAGATAFLPVQSLNIVGAGTSSGTLTPNVTTGTFLYTPNANFSGSDSFTYNVCDKGTPGSACSTDQVVNITITAVNDAPIVTVPGPVTGNEEAAISVTGVSVADVDAGSGNIKVTVSVPVAAGTVAATASGSASVTPASAASIDIVGTITDVNSTLASLSFTGATDFNTVVGSPLTMTVLADDQGNTPAPAKTDQKTVSINVTPVNDAPVVGSSPVSVTTAEDTAKTISIVSDLGVNDNKDTNAPAAAGGATFPSVASINIVGLGTTNGTLTKNTVTGTFLYTPGSNFSGSDSFTYNVCDNGTPGSACSTDQVVNITITPVNDPPVVTLSASALSYTENAAAISVDSGSPTVIDGDSANFNGGSLSASITSFGDTGDTITLVTGGNITQVSPTVDYLGSPIATVSGGTNGTALTISFTSATVTPAVVVELIQQLQYSNTRDSFAQGITTPKVITIRVNDGGSAPNTGSATRGLSVLGVNDAPLLNNTGTMVLNSIPENPTINSGTLVSAILASAGITSISDLDSGALQGIAVIGADTTNGVWQFSINSGVSWTAFGSLSPTSATLLIPSARIRFVPNTFFNGNVNPGITFVAWDRTSSTNGTTGINSTPGGGTSAFSPSSTTETASISVTGVNQAPVLDNTGIMILTPIAEDVPVASNPGTLVSTILASAGGTRITDSDIGALQGIAIIGIDATNGIWQFSINGGTNWIQISAPSNGTAVLLASDSQTLVRFLPNPNYNGTVDPGITFRAWDQTSSANGATLVDVSVNGDPSAFSVATETASIVITSVNDLPTAQDDTAPIAKNSPGTTINVLANDSSLPDIGETLVVTTVSIAQHGTVTIAPGGTAVLYKPAFDYSGLDSFTYTISDGNGGTASATVHIQVGQFYVSLPLVLGEPIKPDLEITNFTVTPAGPNYLFGDKVTISVTVRNTGTLPTGGFYTELYINPSVSLNRAGILWNTVCSIQPCYGMTWYVQSGLVGGQSVTLTSTPGSYYSGNWPESFAPGTTDVYVYADSWNGTEPDGFIKERDETNNMAAIHGLHVAGFGITAQSPSLTVPEQALTTDRNINRDQPLR